MLGLEEDALVVLNVGLQLIVADHGVAEKTELMPCLLMLVIHELVSKLCICSSLRLFSFTFMTESLLYSFSSFGLLLVIIFTFDMVLQRQSRLLVFVMMIR